MWAIVVAAVAVLIASVSVKFWSTVTLTSRYRAEDYLATKEARRLFLLGKVTPVVACLAIVVLSFLTRLWWIELPALMLLGIVAIGVTRIVAKRYAEL